MVIHKQVLGVFECNFQKRPWNNFKALLPTLAGRASPFVWLGKITPDQVVMLKSKDGCSIAVVDVAASIITLAKWSLGIDDEFVVTWFRAGTAWDRDLFEDRCRAHRVRYNEEGLDALFPGTQRAKLKSRIV